MASFIWGKLFTVKTCTLASVAVAAGYAAVYLWPEASAWFFALYALTFVICAGLLRLRKAPPVLVSDVGAVALLAMMLWTTAMFSNNRTSPAAVQSQAEAELKFDVELEFFKSGFYGKQTVAFRLMPSDYHNLKEVFYRVNHEGEFQSSGFNDYDYPILLIETSLTKIPDTLEIKCLDAQGRERGPWIFSFDEDAGAEDRF